MTWRSVLASFALVLAPSAAQAQAITVPNERALPRLDASGAQVQKRPLTQNPEGVNRQDCLDDQRIRFTVQLAGFEANATLSAWASVAGVDCAEPGNRSGESPLCWAIAPAIPLSQVIDVDVPVRTLLAGATTEPASDDRVCGAVDLTSLDVQLLYFAPGSAAVPAVKKTLIVAVDTIGPEPPAGIRAAPAEGGVRVEWDPPKSAVVAANVYCDEPPGTRLGAGTIPTREVEARLRCAEVAGARPAAAFVEKDGPVAVAVSAVDAFGNPGPLSESVSATPAEGEAGGCMMTRAPIHGPGSLPAALAVALGAVVALRRRRVR